MHEILFRLGLRPRPRWGSLQRSPRALPDPLAEFNGPTSKVRERREGKGKGTEGRGRRGRGRERREREGMKCTVPPPTFE